MQMLKIFNFILYNFIMTLFSFCKLSIYQNLFFGALYKVLVQMWCRHDFHQVLVRRPFRLGFPRLCTFMSCIFELSLFFSSSVFPSSLFLELHYWSQMGRVLQYSLIRFFAVPMVCASLISFGAWFHSLLVSLMKLLSACLVFPPSSIVCLVVALTAL